MNCEQFVLPEEKDHVKMCKICKFFEELSVNIRACQQQSNGVECRVSAVPNAFHLLSEVNISAKKICKDQFIPHLLKRHKSREFNELSPSKPDEKAAHCQEKRLNLIYFAIPNFHGYGITAKIKI